MGTRLARTFRVPRGVAFAVTLTVVGGLVIYSTAAGAAPRPTIGQVQAQVNSLQAKVDRVGQQYDQVSQRLAAAQSRLARVNTAAGSEQARYTQARAQLAQVAVAAYEDAGQTSVIGVLTAGDPSTVLAQASLVLQLANTHQAQANEFLADAQQLAAARDQQRRTEEGIAALQAQLSGQKTALAKLLASQQATLDSLTVAQRAQVAAATIGATGTSRPAPAPRPTSTPTPTPSPTSTPTPTPSPTSTPTPAPSPTSAPPPVTGPTSTQAGKAVAFAYAQLGKPYVWGATGPNSYDCSGLVQAAWAAAGVSIPRTTYDQWTALPHVSASSIQPGDLLFYEAEGHVAIYVGNGYIIDAPRTGLNVEKIPMNTGWYAANFDGAVRP